VEPLIFIGILVVLLWLLVLRPQRRRVGEHATLISTLSVVDALFTAGGMYGRITAMDDDVLSVEIAPGITVRVARGAITGVMNSEQKDNEGDTPIAANDR
jgi:preprotein translocase subunit YajC